MKCAEFNDASNVGIWYNTAVQHCSNENHTYPSFCVRRDNKFGYFHAFGSRLVPPMRRGDAVRRFPFSARIHERTS